MKAQRESIDRTPSGEQQVSMGALLADLVRQSGELVKGEIDLAKAEVREEIKHYRRGTVLIASGLALGLLGTMSLLAAGIVAVATQTGLLVSTLIWGVGLALLALIIALVGRSSLTKRH